MNHDHSKKRINKEFGEHPSGCNPKLWVAPTPKVELTSTIKTLRKYTVGFAWCYRGVVTDCEQTSNKTTLNGNDNTSRWKGSKGLWMMLPVVTSLTPRTATQLCNISTTNLLQPAITCSTTPQFFILPTVQQLCRTSRFANSTPTTTDNILWNYDHMRRLISPKSVGLDSSFLFISPCTDIIPLTVTIRYIAPCVLLQPKLYTPLQC